MTGEAGNGTIVTLTVKCDLDNDEIFGRVRVQTTTNQTLDWVLNEFCVEKKVKQKSTFALRNERNQDLTLTLSIEEAKLSDGETILAYNKDPPPPPPPIASTSRKSFVNWWILAAIALGIGAFGIVTVVLVHTFTLRSLIGYCIAIDAGISRSHLYLYKWPAEKLNGTGQVTQKGTANTTSPISVESGVQQLLHAAKALSVTVPEERRRKMQILLATDEGMQLYRSENSTLANKVLRSAELSISNLESANPIVSELSGDEVSRLSWLTVNFVSGSFAAADTDDKKQQVGVLDLTDASARIAFESDGTREVVQQTVYGKSYSTYAAAFACYGLVSARFRALGRSIAIGGFDASRPVEFPCWRSGRVAKVKGVDVFGNACARQIFGQVTVKTLAAEFIVSGSGDSSRCRLLIARFFNSSCEWSSCSLNNRYQPTVTARFLAFGSFADTASFFNLTATAGRQKANLSEFGLLTDNFCSRRGLNITKEETTAWRCFDGIFVETLLRGFGFNETNWSDLTFVTRIPGSQPHGTSGLSASGSVSWPLGLALLRTNDVAAEKPRSLLPLLAFSLLLCLFSFLLLLSIVFACFAARSRSMRGYKAF